MRRLPVWHSCPFAHFVESFLEQHASPRRLWTAYPPLGFAMKFTVIDEIPFPMDQVFKTHRDKLPDMVDYMPNIDKIVVEDREEDGDEVHLVNIWHASETEVPAIARPFIKPELLRWTDRATWDDDAHTVEWNIELGFLPDAITCRGFNEFEEFDGITRITMEGELIVDAAKIPGVPRLLAKKLGTAVEKFVVGLIEPNLRETNKIVSRYMQEENG